MQGSQEKRLPLPEFPLNPSIDPKHIWLGSISGSSYLGPGRKNNMKVYNARRDGYKCMWCLEPEDNLKKLTVHHVDRNIGNNWSDNVQNMHWNCNNEARWGHARPIPQLPPPTPKKPSPQLQATQEIAEDERTTPSHLTNIFQEPEFRRAAFQCTKDMMDPDVVDPEKFFGKRGLMSYCMEKSGSSQDAAYGYMRKLFAPRVGPIIEETELGGKLRTVKFRNPKDYRLSVDDLVKKYPKEGQVYSS